MSTIADVRPGFVCERCGTRFDARVARWSLRLHGAADARRGRAHRLSMRGRASDGAMVVVTEAAIAQAGRRPSSQCLCVEPTCAVGMTGIDVFLARAA